MKKIIGYRVIAHNDADLLEQYIVEWARHGYEIFGNPFVNIESQRTGQEICQVMVKYEPNP